MAVLCSQTVPVAAERGEEEPFSAEDHAFQPARALDVILDARGHRHEATRVDAQHFAPQLAPDDRPSGVNEGKSVASQALQDEPFPAEETGPEAFESDADTRA